MPAIVIGLDVGTTACKAVALDATGRIMHTAVGAYPLRSPRAGWAEQSVGEVWDAAAGTLRELMHAIGNGQVAAVALSGAMHSLLGVRKHGEPVTTAITWADTRATDQMIALRAATDDDALYRRTGCPVQPFYWPAKLRWLHEHHRDAWDNADQWVGVKDWIAHRLTGAWATDPAIASATGLWDIHRGAWDEEALRLARVEARTLPAVLPMRDRLGVVTADAAGVTGLREGTPVVIGGSDGAMANLGSGAAGVDQTVISVGTSGAIRRIVAAPMLDHAGQRTWCYALGDNRWLAGGAINNGGLAAQWMADRFFGGDYEAMFREGDQVEAGADGVTVLPYFTGERSPHWAADARATIHGLSLSHTRAHIARAALEGVACCLADVWDTLPPGASAATVRLTGGITRSPLWCQIVADVIGVPLLLCDVADASAVGAAMIGHAAMGHVDSVEDMASRIPTGATIQPSPARHTAYRKVLDRFRRLGRAVLSH